MMNSDFWVIAELLVLSVSDFDGKKTILPRKCFYTDFIFY